MGVDLDSRASYRQYIVDQSQFKKRKVIMDGVNGSSACSVSKVATDNVVRDENNKAREELIDICFDSPLNFHKEFSHKTNYIEIIEKKLEVLGLSASARVVLMHQVFVWELIKTYYDLLETGRAPYPDPVYIDEGLVETGVSWNPGNHFDLAYYLMLLHATEESDFRILKIMFCAFASTYYPLDHHMIWHQRAVLEAIGLRLNSCFHRYRVSPDIKSKDPSVKFTEILASAYFSLVATLLKCKTQDDSKETRAIPSSNRIKSTCAQIP
ncbi:nuclear pore complex protein NUP96-like protein [Tanacetum coccineum]